LSSNESSGPGIDVKLKERKKERSSKGSHDAQGSPIAGDHRDVSSRGGLHSGSATEGNSESVLTMQFMLGLWFIF
jgi:hypothetical protein